MAPFNETEGLAYAAGHVLSQTEKLNYPKTKQAFHIRQLGMQAQRVLG